MMSSFLGGGGGGGGGTPGAPLGSIQYNNGGAFAGIPGSVVDANGSLVLGGAAVTTSDPVLDITQTWNNAAVDFTGLKLDINVIAAGGNSLFIDANSSIGGRYAFNYSGQQFVTFVGGDTSVFNMDASGSAANVAGLLDLETSDTVTTGRLFAGYRKSDPQFFMIFDFQSGHPCIRIGPGTTAPSVAMCWNAASILEITDSRPTAVGGSLADILVQALRTKIFTVATLPAAGVQGRRSFVSDATATTFASIVAGTGTNPVPVYDDGTNWRIG